MLPFTHMAIRSAVSGAGASKVIVRVDSSTALNLASVPLPERASSGAVCAMYCSAMMSFHQNMMSAVVHGSPSDHFRPLRKLNVHSDASSLDSHDSTRPGTTSLPSLT